MSGPLAGDRLQFRFSGTSEQFGGEYRNTLDGKKTGVLRRYGLTGALSFLPTNNITIDLKGFRTCSAMTARPPNISRGQRPSTASPTRPSPDLLLRKAGYGCLADPPQPRSGRGGLQNTDQKRAILNVDWRLGDYLLTATTTYADQDSDTFCDCDYSGFRSLGGAFQSRFDSSIKNRSQEVRLRSPQSSSFRWMAGAYIFSEDSNTFRSNTTPIIIPFVDVTTKSVFGSVEVDLGEALTVTAEGRYQDERQKRSAIPGNPAIDVTYKAFLPRVIADFKLTDRILLYASAAKGNQPGQFNTGSTFRRTG
jgi:outer membrane receptor protein involved in Fe transport